MGLFAAKSAVLFAAQHGLGHASSRLLLHMALECRDKADAERGIEPRRFWAGRTSQAIGLGFSADECDTPRAHSAVKRTTQELLKSGVLEILEAGRFQRHTEYYLRLNSEVPSADLLPTFDAWAPSSPARLVVGERPPAAEEASAKVTAERPPARFPAPSNRLERLERARIRARSAAP